MKMLPMQIIVIVVVVAASNIMKRILKKINNSFVTVIKQKEVLVG